LKFATLKVVGTYAQFADSVHPQLAFLQLGGFRSSFAALPRRKNTIYELDTRHCVMQMILSARVASATLITIRARSSSERGALGEVLPFIIVSNSFSDQEMSFHIWMVGSSQIIPAQVMIVI
jgi:hypothetical protein